MTGRDRRADAVRALAADGKSDRAMATILCIGVNAVREIRRRHGIPTGRTGGPPAPAPLTGEEIAEIRASLARARARTPLLVMCPHCRAWVRPAGGVVGLHPRRQLPGEDPRERRPWCRGCWRLPVTDDAIEIEMTTTGATR